MVNLEKIAQYAFMAFVVIAVIAGLAVGYMKYDARRDYKRTADLEKTDGDVMLVMLVLVIIVARVNITVK